MISATYRCQPFKPVIPLTASTVSWKRLWEIVQNQLKRRGFADSTISLYRFALRGFLRQQPTTRPAHVTRAAVHAYLWDLTDQHSSWSWIAANICVLRTVFDKLGGMTIATGLRTPKRPFRLPEILAPSEVRAVLRAAPSVRDRLFLGLLYGCGLKITETCQLRWQDIDLAGGQLCIPAGRRTPARNIPLPDELLPVLQEGQRLCQPADRIFLGSHPGRALCVRTAQRVVRLAARASLIGKPVTAMTLRHYAEFRIMPSSAPVAA